MPAISSTFFSHRPLLMTDSNTHLKIWHKSGIWYFSVFVDVHVSAYIVCAYVCIYTVPAHVLSALPAAPAGVVHHTSLRTNPPRVVSLSKHKHPIISLLTASTKMIVCINSKYFKKFYMFGLYCKYLQVLQCMATKADPWVFKTCVESNNCRW